MDLIQIGTRPPDEPGESAETAIDPVCGMTVEVATAPASLEHRGKKYYFCCGHCLTKFRADPEACLRGQKPGQAPAKPGATYTCPMHPEVVQDHPGACPKCGMALEPMAQSLDDGPDPELVDMQRRLWIGRGDCHDRRKQWRRGCTG